MLYSSSMRHVSRACLTGIVSTSLSACNVSTTAARQTPATSGSVQVSDGTQAVQISQPDGSSLTLPAGALTSQIGLMGPVRVTLQAGTASSLSAADRAAVTAGTSTGATVLRAVQLDVAGAGTSTRGLRTQQAASTGTIAFSLPLPAGGTCSSDSIIVKQVVNGKATALLGNALADKATHRQLSAKATATFGDSHLVFFFLCLPSSGLKPHALVSGHPFPRASHAAGSGTAVGIPAHFESPASPFTVVIPGGVVLTVTDTDFLGHEDQFFHDDALGADVSNYDFDIRGAAESNGGQDQSAAAEVAVTGQGSHRVILEEELFDVTSEEDNVAVLTDVSTGASLTVIADQELQNITIMAGNQLEVKRAKHLTTQEISAATARLTIANNPDGTWLIDGQGATTAQEGAQLVLKSPIGTGASLHGLVFLLGLVVNQKLLIAEPTLMPCNPAPPRPIASGPSIGDGYAPPADSRVNARGGISIKQAALPPAASNLARLLQAIIQLREQKLTP